MRSYLTVAQKEREHFKPGERIESSDIAEPFRQSVRETIKKKYQGNSPLLVGFLANDDPAAQKYAEWTSKACENDGVKFELRKVDRLDLEELLEEANNDPTVHGIIVYYPVFGSRPSFYGGSMDDYLRDCISPTKDVEGLCFTYRHNLYHNIRTMPLPANSSNAQPPKSILPCTPLAVVKILEHLQVYDQSLAEGFRMNGKIVTIFNRSEVVGRPLAAMLANDGADVYSVDVSSIYLMRKGKLFETEETLESACRLSHVIVTGVPSKEFRLNPKWIRPQTKVINVSSYKNVDEDEILRVQGVVYVPNVGKVTVSMLQRNLLRLHVDYHNFKSK